ncbi:sporulation integral membrane protein YlbJ [Alkaliphilus hydrothermalis]|uniref:Sporulation integral membrane protein YlbJ n=1 Tax=Alkaliphilus hydrothermalis TaxID=1482730 RepID=A0ABS2NSA1_9FIRM|nr:sporulation integral membrane protein YlbJ [Alkaliphilus hydrothermalis]MBM7615833.1 sporulation integral membrane protein YlbJ [Alkaliphilus hydrothermalis]
MPVKSKIKYYLNTYLAVFVVFFFVLTIVLYPEQSVKSAYEGLITWVTIVLPALLPFFVGAELLIGLGVVKFIGVLLEPLMRPLFNVPGEGSFAFTMSVTSGYPVGAKIISKLRLDNQITLVEAQRLVAFCSTSGPLFLMGAVGVGMFKSKEIGYYLAITHYIAAISVGLVFAFYKRSATSTVPVPREKNRIRQAFRQLAISRKQNPPFGLLMGNAVRESFNTMLMVGGFIIMFSVIINILNEVGIVEVFSYFFYILLKPLNMSLSMIQSLMVGFFEITIGSKMVVENIHSTVLTKMAVTAFIMAWSGFSIHAQCISIIGATDINTTLYMGAKLLHGIFAAAIVYLLYPFASNFLPFSRPVFHQQYLLNLTYPQQFYNTLKFSLEIFVVIVIVLLVTSIFLSLLLSLSQWFKRKR